MPVSVVVLAAGQGKRMHSNLPKVLQPVAGRPLLGHVLDTARALEPVAIHVVYGHGGDRVQQTFADPNLVWCLQAEQLGTGHAVSQGLPGIPDEHVVVVLCGDVPLVRAETVQRLTGSANDGKLALLTAELDDPHGYGRVLRDELGRVTRIVEEKDASDDERRIREINTGLLAARAGDLRRWLSRVDNDNAQGEYYLTDIIGMAVADERAVEGVLVEEAQEVLGINDKAQLAVAERVYQRRQAQRLMSLGVTVIDPERVDVRGTLECGRDVVIDVGAVFEGSVRLGDRVRIGPYCVVVDADLGDDTVVHSHSVLQGINAGAACEIGPFARVRPGTELDAKVKIGNFVEVKNTRAAEGAKMNHLSYIGDTTLGRSVNVGAGTITCNYDGAAKHRTEIGDGAFIGSGTMLVAPVQVGDGATIGAGSTITKNAPGGALTVARARQTTIEGWQRPVKKPK